jgi:hypothetical protein
VFVPEGPVYPTATGVHEIGSSEADGLTGEGRPTSTGDNGYVVVSTPAVNCSHVLPANLINAGVSTVELLCDGIRSDNSAIEGSGSGVSEIGESVED